MKKFLLLIFLTPFIAGAQGIFWTAPAANGYWVDPAGNDANSGRTPGSPVATIAQLTANDATVPRPVWNLKAGATWHEQVIVPRASMTVQSLGTIAGNNLAFLDASDPISAGSWSLTGGQTVVYQATLTTAQFTPSSADWCTSVWENSTTRFQIEHSIAAVAAQTGSYYATGCSSGTTLTLYIHTSDSSNPGVNGKTYEWAARSYGVLVGGPSNTVTINDVVRGVHSRRQQSANGSIATGQGWKLFQIQVDDGNKHNILIGKNTYIDGLTASEAYFEGLGAGMVELFDDPDSSAGVTIRNATAQCASYTGLFGCGTGTANGGNVGGFAGHTSSIGSEFGYFNCINCTATNLQAAYGPEDVLSVGLTNSSATNFQVGVEWTTNGAAGGALNLEGGAWAMGNIAAATFASLLPTNGSAIIDNATVTMANSQSSIAVVTTSSNAVALTLTNNHFLNTGSVAWNSIVSQNNTGASLTSTGNVFQGGPVSGINNPSYVYALFSTPLTLTSNNNSFATPMSDNAAFLIGVNNYGYSAYTTATGQDSTSSFQPLQVVYDFGSYPNGATPTVVTNSINPGYYDLVPTAITFNGHAGVFDGSTASGQSIAAPQSNYTFATIVDAAALASTSDFSASAPFVWGTNGSAQPLAFYNRGGQSVSSSTTVSTGLWYFLAFTSGPAGSNIYIGNAGTVSSIGSNVAASNPATNFVGTLLQVGAAYGGGSQFFHGQMAQMEVENHAANLSELQTLYNSWVTLNAGRGVTVQ